MAKVHTACHNVLNLKAGKVIYATDKKKDYGSAIKQTLSDVQFSRNACKFEKKYKDFSPVAHVKEIIDLAEDLIAR